jgi:hypothetical protein
MKLDGRLRLALAGGLGLVANAAVMLALGYWRGAQEGPGWLLALLERRAPASADLIILIIALVLLAFALAEIPVMIVALRAMQRSPSRPARLIEWLTALFVFFAAVYGGLLVLLTLRLDLGLVIAGTGILRLMAVALGLVGFRKPSA